VIGGPYLKMNFIDIAADFMRQYQDIILLSAVALALVSLVCTIRLTRRVGRLSRKALGAIDGETGRDLREEFTDCKKIIGTIENRLDVTDQQQMQIKAQQELCVQRLGFVRFDAFDDVGGEQSFALALLDASNNGVVVSNLFSRVDSRVYAKPIKAGASEHTLSKEEQEALRKAVLR
jgi:hypothetical protein